MVSRQNELEAPRNSYVENGTPPESRRAFGWGTPDRKNDNGPLNPAERRRGVFRPGRSSRSGEA